MDEQTLERLMMDDALGALAPDVKMLLEAYVKQTGTEAERHGQWIALGAAAEEAVRGLAVEELPPFPGGRVRIMRLWGASLAIAAAVVVGIGIGLFMQRPEAEKTVAAESSAVVAEPAEMLGVTDFWSSKRLVAEALAAPRNPSQWEWPSRMGRMGVQP